MDAPREWVYHGRQSVTLSRDGTTTGVTMNTSDNHEDGSRPGNGLHRTDIGDLPLGIMATPQDAPDGLHYLYQENEVLMLTEDYERLVRARDEELGNRVRKLEPGERDAAPRGNADVFGSLGKAGTPRASDQSRRSRDEVLASIGVTRLVTTDPDDDVPATVNALRGVRHLRHPVTNEVEHFTPRAFPNTIASLNYHKVGHVGVGTARWAPPLSPPPRRRLLPLPGHGVTIGVLDTGMWPGRLDWYNGQVEAIDEDHLGYQPGDLPPDVPSQPIPGDSLTRSDGHGTFIAGIILAHAPGAEVVVRAISAMEGGYDEYLTDDALAHAILDMADSGVDIISLSVSALAHANAGPCATTNAIEKLRVTHPNLVIVAAAGNDGAEVQEFPAALNTVVGVGAVKADADERADFSCYGEWVDVSAPGVDIHSTFVDWSHPRFEGFATWSGTSFSTPMVAAAIATRKSPGGWRQLLWFLKPRTVRAAADRLIHDPHLPRVRGMGTVVRPKSYVR